MHLVARRYAREAVFEHASACNFMDRLGKTLNVVRGYAGNRYPAVSGRIHRILSIISASSLNTLHSSTYFLRQLVHLGGSKAGICEHADLTEYNQHRRPRPADHDRVYL